MRTHRTLAALILLAGQLLAAPPARAQALPDCPAPTSAEIRRAEEGRTDQPPRGARAIAGLRLGHLPAGFSWGQVGVSTHDGMTEYGYLWSDDRDDVDRRHRSLWVRVACWPEATGPAKLRTAPFLEGTFTGDVRRVKVGKRTVLTKEGDGALGHGRYAGWVEREGVMITVMASRPLVRELNEIIKGITLR
ncbi:hypothetical protein GCM10010156_62920 [Planobispora rosea]|uniref:Secreted protein n=1 Tax=Planobispora rosea TaxID=35762 RepID=A0A8J3S4D2_PLARO|nr:hypothetical protein [Planobispora rosea]GGS96101.1 hypothetical protein GCM10010156_62920 [Planobispora rosea]GIH87592.1 hypothetical protein Pro02_60000 [Planobispora rosea]